MLELCQEFLECRAWGGFVSGSFDPQPILLMGLFNSEVRLGCRHSDLEWGEHREWYVNASTLVAMKNLQILLLSGRSSQIANSEPRYHFPDLAEILSIADDIS